MQSINDVIISSLSSFKGSEVTRSLVGKIISARWGETELKNFDPYHNTRTFHSWAKLGFKVKKGEKAIKSYTIVNTKDHEGNIIKSYKHPVALFYYRQVEKIDQN